MHQLRYTPLHPQWFAYRHEQKRHEMVGRLAQGRVLDIGCGRQPLRSRLNANCDYTGMDSLDTGATLYGAKPQVFGDAHSLPFADGTFDTVLLLEVLEHLPEPQTAVKEAKRVLSPNGRLILSTPFLYPIHDAPTDYQRWTKYGLRHLVEHENTDVEIRHCGKPTETAALLTSIALASIALNALEKRAPSILLLPLLAAGVVVANLTGWILAKLFPDNDLMPIGYFISMTASDRLK